MMDNKLYYGDNLRVLRDYIADDSVDLIYLDPPFNSKADYNILFKEPAGNESKAQITAFEDTWHWTEETQSTFEEIVRIAPASVVEMMRAFKGFIKENDMMAYLTMMCIRLIELKRVLKESGSIYLHCDPTASHYLKMLMDTEFGKDNFMNEIVWFYKDPSGKTTRFFRRKHDIILFYSKKETYYFNADAVRIPYSKSTLKQIENGTVSFGRVSKGNPLGKVPEDVWAISIINSQAKERLGYPTQKPEALLERIIMASSKEGDVVLDPFCGCGTTITVAQRLNRKWIGIDITHLAINLIKSRLNSAFGLEYKKDYEVIGEPKDISGARELALQNRYQFQWWALSLIDARPYGDKKKGADTGIDGYLYFLEGQNKVKKIIVQVKSGKVSVNAIRDLGHVIDREQAEIGIFITLEQPTEPMAKEAIIKGAYKSEIFNKDYPKIQILTIEDLFLGKKPNLPPTIPVFKQAQRVSTEEQLEF